MSPCLAVIRVLVMGNQLEPYPDNTEDLVGILLIISGVVLPLEALICNLGQLLDPLLLLDICRVSL